MIVTTLLSHVAKHLRLCFRFCKFYNNQSRPDDKPRSLATDGDTITISLVISFFPVLFVLAQRKVTSIVQSYNANNNGMNHQHIKGSVLMLYR